MRARLMFADRDLRFDREPGVGEADLVADLGLDSLWAAMAQGDRVILQSVQTAMLDACNEPDRIRYRQAALADCLAHPDLVKRIYTLAGEGATADRELRRGIFSNHAEALVRRSIALLERFIEILKQLRAIAELDAGGFGSEAFSRFFETLRVELDDDYFEEISGHLRQLHFRGGVLGSARLGKQGQGVDYVLRTPRHASRILGFLTPSVPRPSFSWRVPARDEGAGQELAALRDRLLTIVADAVGQSTDHIAAFFAALRAELGFYVGCLHLHEQLSAKGEPLSMPEPHPPGGLIRHAVGLYDPCLSLRLDGRVRGNELRADGKPVIIITGANQGGKSTFLRSLGLAQLMMQAGMFVAADAFAATVVGGVFTHFRREEDASMTSGKFEEELERMSRLASAIDGDDLLLCNESFAATNEREGSEIAGEVLRALADNGNSVVFVTHLYELAERWNERDGDRTLFLRADRGEDGRRPYLVGEGAPLPTSYGEDLFRQTFPAPTVSRDRCEPDDRTAR